MGTYIFKVTYSVFLYFLHASSGVVIISASKTASNFATDFRVILCNPDNIRLISLSVLPKFLANSFCDQPFSLRKTSTCSEIARFFLTKILFSSFILAFRRSTTLFLSLFIIQTQVFHQILYLYGQSSRLFHFQIGRASCRER